MDSIKEIKVGRPLSLGIPRTKDEINLYAKNYYHLKGRQLVRCECCDTEVVKSNFLKHTRTKVHLKNDLYFVQCILLSFYIILIVKTCFSTSCFLLVLQYVCYI